MQSFKPKPKGQLKAALGAIDAVVDTVSAVGDMAARVKTASLKRGASRYNHIFGAPIRDSQDKRLAVVKFDTAKGPGTGRLVLNVVWAPTVRAFFADVAAQGLSGLIKTVDGGWVYRVRRSGSSLSTHAWGTAFDLNASTNPMGSRSRPSKPTADQQLLINIAVKHGIYPGSVFNDPMHFQAVEE